MGPVDGVQGSCPDCMGSGVRPDRDGSMTGEVGRAMVCFCCTSPEVDRADLLWADYSSHCEQYGLQRVGEVHEHGPVAG